MRDFPHPHPHPHRHDCAGAGGAPQIEGLDPLSMQVFHELKRHGHIQRQIMTRGTSSGFSFPRVACLRTLAHADGISQRDLAEMLHLSRPTVTTLLQGLEDDGYIERRPDEKDRRVTRAFITERGREVNAEGREFFTRQLNETIGTMSEEDRSELARLLKLLNDRGAQFMNENSEGNA